MNYITALAQVYASRRELSQTIYDLTERLNWAYDQDGSPYTDDPLIIRAEALAETVLPYSASRQGKDWARGQARRRRKLTKQ